MIFVCPNAGPPMGGPPMGMMSGPPMGMGGPPMGMMSGPPMGMGGVIYIFINTECEETHSFIFTKHFSVDI